MATILIVDDDHDFLVCTAERLRRKAHEVMVAADGRLALDILERLPIDAVITDLFMPRTDGIELIIEVRRRFSGVPVIAMSGGHPDMIGPMRNLTSGYGAVVFLQKPFTAIQMEAAIQSALAPDRAPGAAARQAEAG